MKYYVYISDTKVDMLLAQIPHDFKQRVATQFKIDLKVLSGSRTVERESDDNRFTRLETVCEFIRAYGNVGAVDEPGEYISDELRMRWGPFGDRDPREAPIVYFGGITKQTVIGLGGSIKHVIGSPGQSSASAPPLTGSGGFTLALYLKLMMELGSESRDLVDTWAQDEEMLWSNCVEWTTLHMGGPIQTLQFLAKRLLERPACSDYKHIVLATPLYVAMAE